MPGLQLSSRLQALLSVDKYTPALRPPSAVASDDMTAKPVVARCPGILEHLIVKGAGLEEDGRDPQLLGLLEDLEGGKGRRDDGHGRLLGVWQGRERRLGRERLRADVDAGAARVDGNRWDIVLDIPGKDLVMSVSISRMSRGMNSAAQQN